MTIFKPHGFFALMRLQNRQKPIKIIKISKIEKIGEGKNSGALKGA
ncbi:hypothetical protein [Xenorhabdus doucetiae]|nr:hypothetical protein [Xenorhabdus sp. 3]